MDSFLVSALFTKGTLQQQDNILVSGFVTSHKFIISDFSEETKWSLFHLKNQKDNMTLVTSSL